MREFGGSGILVLGGDYSWAYRPRSFSWASLKPYGCLSGQNGVSYKQRDDGVEDETCS